MASKILLVNNVLLFSIVFIVALNICCTNASNDVEFDEKYECDRVINLPGQPKSPIVSQFSGYITVDEAHGRALFYWFFEAQSQPIKKPLLLWLNGGPGSSSIGYGAAVELGPLRVANDGATLEFNQHSWNQEANLLFVESPIGVGFSYTNNSSDFANINDEFVAEDTYTFLVNWMKRFSIFKGHDFYISGESYGGHYVPQLAELIYDRNKNTNKYPHINLKGFIVGNPDTDDPLDFKGYVQYAWGHSVISDEEYHKAIKSCNFKLQNWSTECDKAMDVVFDRYREIDVYDIYAPKCLLNESSSSAAAAGTVAGNSFSGTKVRGQPFGRMRKNPGGYDPCYTQHVEAYFNKIDVQRALHINFRRHINVAVKWRADNDSLLQNYNFTVPSVLPIYSKLIKAGLRIWMYNGDTDGRATFIGTRYCVESLKLPPITPWSTWYNNQQVAGRTLEYKGLTYATSKGAGHMVPFDKPEEALALIRSYLSGQPLRKHR